MCSQSLSIFLVDFIVVDSDSSIIRIYTISRNNVETKFSAESNSKKIGEKLFDQPIW
jgi:hypothetical protein